MKIYRITEEQLEVLLGLDPDFVEESEKIEEVVEEIRAQEIEEGEW